MNPVAVCGFNRAQTLQSDEGVYIHEAITMMPAAWQRRGLDPPDQLQSVLGGRGLNSP